MIYPGVFELVVKDMVVISNAIRFSMAGVLHHFKYHAFAYKWNISVRCEW